MSMPTGQIERQTDGRTPDRYITLSATWTLPAYEQREAERSFEHDFLLSYTKLTKATVRGSIRGPGYGIGIVGLGPTTSKGFCKISL